MKKRVFASAFAVILLLLCGCGQKQTLQNPSKIQQVLPMSDGAVAVLYADGTVKIAGNNQLSEAVKNWSSVEELYNQYSADWTGVDFQETSYLLARTEKGSVLSTAEDYSHWKHIKEINCLGYYGVLAITDEGEILTDHLDMDGSIRQSLEQMDNVETVVYSQISDYAACLFRDGTVKFVDAFSQQDANWQNIKEVRDSGHAFYGITREGTVVGGLEESNTGLDHAKKVVSYCDLLFGISEDGRLLTSNGGNIYSFGGIIAVDVPGSQIYSGEVDIRTYNQVEDIEAFSYGLLLRNRDGSVDTIGSYPWDLSQWQNIRKLYAFSRRDENGNDVTSIYGLQSDGSVILSRDDGQGMERYRGWQLQEIFLGEKGVVGLTMEGNLVGDGAYEHTDFSGI